jgi:hypothetical protein
MPAPDASEPRPAAAQGVTPGDSVPPGDSLPPVEAPTATFILQLFLIPLVIVTIVVLLWLMFSWLAHMGRDNPATLVTELRKLDENSWQRAYELADLLRSPDPKYDALRHDPKLAASLAAVLSADLKPSASGPADPSRIKRRMFVCRALGSFYVLDPLPALLASAAQQNDPLEAEVRLSALEGIASLARNVGPEKIRADAEAMKVLLAASREVDDGSPPPVAADGEETTYRPRAEIRAVAAYGLGVVGGKEALARLRVMVHDAYPNARYNAATGLARAGDEACIPVLKEMLDPDNQVSARDEKYADDKDRKRWNVVNNGLKATLLLAQTNPEADIAPLIAALEKLSTSKLPAIQRDKTRLKNNALEALRTLRKPASAK